MISRLNLNRNDVEEKYVAPKRHLKPLPSHLQKEVDKKRIEIDSVLNAIGPEKLWKYLEEKMLELAPERDLTRSIDLIIPLPSEISKPLMRITGFIRSVGSPTQKEHKAKLEIWRRPFIDIEKAEKSFQSKVLKVIRRDERIQQLAEQLNRIADEISKISQKMDSK